MKKLLLIFTLIGIQINAQKEDSFLSSNFDLSKLTDRADRSTMFIDGKDSGYWYWKISQDSNYIFVTDTSVLYNRVHEVLNLKISKHDLSKSSVGMSMRFGENKLENNFSFDGVKVTVESYSKINGEEKNSGGDTLLTFDTPRTVLIALLPVMKFEEGSEFSLNLFNSIQGNIFPVKLNVSTEDNVITPAGKWDCWKVEVMKTGMNGVSNIFYVSKDQPTRIVKTTVIENPMSIELVEYEDK